MARYRKKPVVIEAIQYDGLNLEEIRRFVGSSLVYHIFDAAWKAGACQPVVDMKIKTLEGEVQVRKGDYIIKGVHGEFYPCKPDIFKETYELENIADVVPKSEEGAECPTCHGTGRIGTTDWLTKNISKKQLAEEKAKAIAEHEQHIKAEVVREIFDDIANMMVLQHGFNEKHIVAHIDFELLKELKKKYVEERHE